MVALFWVFHRHSKNTDKMSIIIRLQNLPWSASAMDIRRFFFGLQIPDGGVHIVGGDHGDAFIAFSSDEDARKAMMLDRGRILDAEVRLLLSSKSEMQTVIITARNAAEATSPKSDSQSFQAQPNNPYSSYTPNTQTASYTPEPSTRKDNHDWSNKPDEQSYQPSYSSNIMQPPRSFGQEASTGGRGFSGQEHSYQESPYQQQQPKHNQSTDGQDFSVPPPPFNKPSEPAFSPNYSRSPSNAGPIRGAYSQPPPRPPANSDPYQNTRLPPPVNQTVPSLMSTPIRAPSPAAQSREIPGKTGGSSLLGTSPYEKPVPPNAHQSIAMNQSSSDTAMRQSFGGNERDESPNRFNRRHVDDSQQPWQSNSEYGRSGDARGQGMNRNEHQYPGAEPTEQRRNEWSRGEQFSGPKPDPTRDNRNNYGRGMSSQDRGHEFARNEPINRDDPPKERGSRWEPQIPEKRRAPERPQQQDWRAGDRTENTDRMQPGMGRQPENQMAPPGQLDTGRQPQGILRAPPDAPQGILRGPPGPGRDSQGLRGPPGPGREPQGILGGPPDAARDPQGMRGPSDAPRGILRGPNDGRDSQGIRGPLDSRRDPQGMKGPPNDGRGESQGILRGHPDAGRDTQGMRAPRDVGRDPQGMGGPPGTRRAPQGILSGPPDTGRDLQRTREPPSDGREQGIMRGPQDAGRDPPGMRAPIEPGREPRGILRGPQDAGRDPQGMRGPPDAPRGILRGPNDGRDSQGIRGPPDAGREPRGILRPPDTDRDSRGMRGPQNAGREPPSQMRAPLDSGRGPQPLMRELPGSGREPPSHMRAPTDSGRGPQPLMRELPGSGREPPGQMRGPPEDVRGQGNLRGPHDTGRDPRHMQDTAEIGQEQRGMRDAWREQSIRGQSGDGRMPPDNARGPPADARGRMQHDNMRGPGDRRMERDDSQRPAPGQLRQPSDNGRWQPEKDGSRRLPEDRLNRPPFEQRHDEDQRIPPPWRRNQEDSRAMLDRQGPFDKPGLLQHPEPGQGGMVAPDENQIQGLLPTPNKKPLLPPPPIDQERNIDARPKQPHFPEDQNQSFESDGRRVIQRNESENARPFGREPMSGQDSRRVVMKQGLLDTPDIVSKPVSLLGQYPGDQIRQEEFPKKPASNMDVDVDGDVYRFMTNLPRDTAYREVRKFFSSNNCIIPNAGLKLINDDHGNRTGESYIMFRTEIEARKAMQLNGQFMRGNRVTIVPVSKEQYDIAIDSFHPEKSVEIIGTTPEDIEKAAMVLQNQQMMGRGNTIPPRESVAPFVQAIQGKQPQQPPMQGRPPNMADRLKANERNIRRGSPGSDGRHSSQERMPEQRERGRRSPERRGSARRSRERRTSSEERRRSPARRNKSRSPRPGSRRSTSPYIVVSRCPRSVTRQNIRDLFVGLKIARKGDAIHLEVNSTGGLSGSALIQMDSERDYTEAAKKRNCRISGVPVRIYEMSKKEYDERIEKSREHRRNNEKNNEKQDAKKEDSKKTGNQESGQSEKSRQNSESSSNADKDKKKKETDKSESQATLKRKLSEGDAQSAKKAMVEKPKEVFSPKQTPGGNINVVSPFKDPAGNTDEPALSWAEEVIKEEKEAALNVVESDMTCVMVDGLPANCSETKLGNFFKHQQIESKGIHLIKTGPNTVHHTGFVEFIDAEECKKALWKNKALMDLSVIGVTGVRKAEMLKKKAAELNECIKKMEAEAEPIKKKPLLSNPVPPPAPVSEPALEPPAAPEPRPLLETPSPRPLIAQAGGTASRPPMNAAQPGCALQASNLPYHATLKDIENIFCDFNPNADEILIKYDPSGRATGVALIPFFSPNDVQKAWTALHKSEQLGRRLYLRRV